MEVKKSSKADLEKYSKFFMLLGLLFALVIVYNGLEYKAPYVVEVISDGAAEDELEEEIPITQQEIEEIKPPPPPPPPAPEIIEVIKDDSEVEEAVLESTETDEDEVIEDVPDVVEEVEEEEEIDEIISFRVIESVPVFPGCKGSKEELRKCLNKKINKHIQKNFNADLAQDLNLAPGRKRISVKFIVGKDGNITGIQTRAPHPRLEKEAKRIINKLPRMTPGKQRNKAVRVSYTLPINFMVEDD